MVRKAVAEGLDGDTLVTPRTEICRKIDLCKSRGAGPTGNGPVRCPRGKKSDGKSTCANLRNGICRKIDLCKPFSCTSRIFDRIFPSHAPHGAPPGRNLSENRPVQTFQFHKSHFRQVFSSGPCDGSATARFEIASGVAVITTETDVRQKLALAIVMRRLGAVVRGDEASVTSSGISHRHEAPRGSFSNMLPKMLHNSRCMHVATASAPQVAVASVPQVAVASVPAQGGVVAHVEGGSCRAVPREKPDESATRAMGDFRRSVFRQILLNVGCQTGHFWSRALPKWPKWHPLAIMGARGDIWRAKPRQKCPKRHPLVIMGIASRYVV